MTCALYSGFLQEDPIRFTSHNPRAKMDTFIVEHYIEQNRYPGVVSSIKFFLLISLLEIDSIQHLHKLSLAEKKKKQKIHANHGHA